MALSTVGATSYTYPPTTATARAVPSEERSGKQCHQRHPPTVAARSSPVNHPSGDEFERIAVGRSDDSEVPSVERRDRLDVQAFGDRDDRSVDESEPQVGVGVNQGRWLGCSRQQ